MLNESVRALEARKKEVHIRWKELLSTERANSPLANPDTLVYLIDTTFDSIIDSLLKPLVSKQEISLAYFRTVKAKCSCGKNPYLAYFVAAEQAFLEALINIQADSGPLDPYIRDSTIKDLYSVIRTIALKEIEDFCSLCQLRKDLVQKRILSAQ
jgi:hypothetical protein